MSIKLNILSLTLVTLFLGCDEENSEDFTSLSEREKNELINTFDKTSDYFLQPSEMYRQYKDSALNVDPTNVDLLQRLSYSYKKVGEHIKAMEILKRAVEIDIANGNSRVLEYRAWTLLYYYRDFEGTIRDVDQIEKINGSAYNTCWGEPCGFHKGQALYKLEKFKEAIETFERVNDQEEKLGFNIDDNHMIFYYIGRCYSEMKDYNKAIMYYKKSLASVERFPEAYYQLGLVYKELNKNAKAEESFKLAKANITYSMGEPYIERFDEVFQYMIDEEL